MFTLRKPLVVVALTAAVGVGFVAGASFNGRSTSVQAITVPVAPVPMMADKRKDIHRIVLAARHLARAAKVLRYGEKEYGGHRVAALRATREALMQCKAAIMFVRHHHPNHGG
jgi:uncharacterized membrane protein